AVRERIGFSSIAGRFGADDADALRTRMAEAGFAQPTVGMVELTLRYPDYRALVRSATEADLARLPVDERTAAAEAIAERLRGEVREGIDGEAVRCAS